MAYAVLPDRDSGQLVTDGDWDILRDNLAYFYQRPMCVLNHNADQTITDGAAEAAVTFNTEDVDTDGMHEGVTNPTRITIQTAGVYWIGFYLYINAGAVTGSTGSTARLMKNGATSLGYTPGGHIPPNNSGQDHHEHSIYIECSAADYFEVMVYGDWGGGNDGSVDNDTASPLFWALMVNGPTS